MGSGRSFNITTIVGSENVGKYTKDNFIAVPSGTSLTANSNRSIGSEDQPSATASVTSGTITYNTSTGAVSIGGFVATTTVCKYGNGGGQINTSTNNLTVTVYFLDNVEIISN